MPVTPKKPCAKQGCSRLTRETYCAQCLPKIEARKKAESQKYDDQRGNSSDRGYDWQWRKVRYQKIDRDRLCECNRCRAMGRIKVATLVHHIKPIKTHPDLRLVMSNLMSMDDHCHEVQHGRAKDKEYVDWQRGRLNN